ncbi:MAG: RelA/SpoT family protein [Salibacteraceae bacterium]
MRKKGIPLEEVYDVFAIRIILDSKAEEEKSECWKVYSIVTDFYKPNPDRLRDWISTPKGNGYESLHTTVMSPSGKYVEVQIRTRRMDEIAEKGLAAHWKYKESASENALDDWIGRVREMLEIPEPNALEFVDEFKMNLFADEIFVFTPNGELRKLPMGSTALDFAFDIHTQVGERCIGAKVNHKLVPLSHPLKSGDQVEIITSKKQKPKEDWLKFVVTAKAKSKIKTSLKEEKRRVAGDGKGTLQRKLRSNKITFTEANVNQLVAFYKQVSALDLFYQIGLGNLDLSKLKTIKRDGDKIDWKSSKQRPSNQKSLEELVTNVRGKAEGLVLGDSLENIDYKLAPCCNPIPGDQVFGFVTINDGIKIHRVNCPNAVQLMSNYAYRIVKAKWLNQDSLAFLAGIKVIGFDHVGLVNDITRVISDEYNVNMRSISFEENDGTFEGTLMVFVNDVQHLTELMEKLKNVDGVDKVNRIDSN